VVSDSAATLNRKIASADAARKLLGMT